MLERQWATKAADERQSLTVVVCSTLCLRRGRTGYFVWLMGVHCSLRRRTVEVDDLFTARDILPIARRGSTCRSSTEEDLHLHLHHLPLLLTSTIPAASLGA